MVWSTLGALAGQYAMGKIEANSANAASKQSSNRAALLNFFMQNYQMKQQEKYNEKMFNKQVAYNKEMFQKEVQLANSAHQREMADLKKAGLNPTLTAMGGNGAGGASIGSVSSNGISPGTNIATPYSAKGINLGNITDYLKNSRENRLADYQEMIAKANSAKAIQETANLAQENPYIGAKAKAEIAHNQAQSAKALSEAGRAAMETETGYKIMDYRVSQEFGKAAQELYQGRLSDVSADFLNKYGFSRQEAFRLGEDGLKVLGAVAGAGLGKKALGAIGHEILKKTSAKQLNFSNFPK